MDTPKKRPLGYADLSIVQLKTFADRGDPRAKEELAKRLGMSAAATAPGHARAGGAPAAPVAGTPTLGARHAGTFAQPAPAGFATASPRSAQATSRTTPQAPGTSSAHGAANHREGRDAQSAPPAPAQVHQRPPHQAAQHGVSAGGVNTYPNPAHASTATFGSPQDMAMSPQAAAALRQAEALLSAASPRMASTPSHTSTPHGANLLINDAPGASGTMSPELLARLEEIARNAPEEDEAKPPVLLGLGMLLLGAIVTLFGFSVTRGATGTWYFVACGLAMAASGWLYFKGMKLAMPVYALTCAMTVLWAVYESPTWLEAGLRMGPALLIAGYAFTGSVRERLG